MIYRLSRTFLGICSLLALFTLFESVPVANAQSLPGKGPSCQHTYVHLQGKNKPIVGCTATQNSSKETPFISVTGCDSESLVLYWDSNFSGDTICFDGSGSTDLTSYCSAWDHGGCLVSWNDQASSYKAYDVSGSFYIDIGDNGSSFGFVAFQSGNFGGSVGNDQLSSVNLQSCRANDNLGEIADHFISRCRRASIRREFPGQYLYSTLGAIKNDSSAAGKTAWKLLNDNRFTK